MSKTPASSAFPYVWMLCGSLSFTFMGTLAHILRLYCDWQVIALARTGLALLFALLMAWAAETDLVLWRPRILWVRSTAGSISLVCTFYSFTQMPLADVLTMTNLFPVWVAILSWPIEGEIPSWGVWLSVLSGVGGVVLIQQPRFAQGEYSALAALAASFATAIAMMGLHRLHNVEPWAIVAHFSGVGVLFCVVALAVGKSIFAWPAPGSAAEEEALDPTRLSSAWVWVMLLAVGISATIGQLFLTKAFIAGAPARVSVVGLTQVVFALAVDAVLFGVEVGPRKIIGTFLIVIPTACMMVRGFSRPDDS
jgi:drug/metabolite transporter (DMT)-like permease